MPDNIQNQENTTEQSEKILGKFNSNEDLAAAYQELERKLAAGGKQMVTNEDGSESVEPIKEEVPTETPDEPVKEGKEAEAVYGEGIVSALSAAGLDVNAVAQEYESEAGVSEETRAVLDNTFGKAVVDSYFRGLEAGTAENTQASQQALADVQTAAGGEEAWQSIQAWASGPNADQGLVDAFNEAVDSGNTAVMRASVIAMRSVYEQTNGPIKETSVTEGGSTASGVASGFSDNSEMIAAMRDPRYNTSPAYRAEVQRRISKSKGLEVR